MPAAKTKPKATKLHEQVTELCRQFHNGLIGEEEWRNKVIVVVVNSTDEEVDEAVKLFLGVD